MRHQRVKPKPRCPVQKKAMYPTQVAASQAMFRTWSHDPSMDIFKYHTYVCPHCKTWHFGNLEYFQQAQSRQNAQLLENSNQNT